MYMGTVQGREPEEVDYEYSLVKGNRYLIKKVKGQFNNNYGFIGNYHKTMTTPVFDSDGDFVTSLKVTYEFNNVLSMSNINRYYKDIIKGEEVILFDKNLSYLKNANFIDFMTAILDLHEKNKNNNPLVRSITNVHNITPPFLRTAGKNYKIYRLKYDILRQEDEYRELVEKQKLLDSVIGYTLGNTTNEVSRDYIRRTNPNLHSFNEFVYNSNNKLNELNYEPNITVNDSNINDVKEVLKQSSFVNTLNELNKKGKSKYTFGGKRTKKNKKMKCNKTKLKRKKSFK